MAAGTAPVDRNSHFRKAKPMGEQQSQKHGVRSEAQKEDEARDARAPIPASSPVSGAFGERKRETPSDQELSLSLDERRRRQENS